VKGRPHFLESFFRFPSNLLRCEGLSAVRFGTSGRNILSGPNFFNADASLFKIFNFTERIKAELRAESFSVTNTAQFSNPTTDVSNANYGYVTGAGGARGMQLGFKLSF